MDKCHQVEKERDELRQKLDSGNLVDLDTLQKVKQEKHKLQKEVSFLFVVEFSPMGTGRRQRAFRFGTASGQGRSRYRNGKEAQRV